MTTIIDLNEAYTLSRLIALAKAEDEIIIVENSTPVARITAILSVSSPRRLRVAGLHQGTVSVSDDFDQQLPDDFWLGVS